MEFYFGQTPPPRPQVKKKKLKPALTWVGVALLILAVAAVVIFLAIRKDTVMNNSGLLMPGGGSVEPLHEPKLKTEELVGGYSNIWDMVFADNNTLVFDERGGKLHGVKLDTKEKWEIAVVPNVLPEGEGGLLGLAKDKDFATNKLMYACYNAAGRTRAVKVTRFKLSDDFKSATEFTDIITSIQSQGGRHSGCRMQMDASSNLWIGTGDSAIGTAPQDPKSLGGKLLRVNRDGQGVEGNLGAPFDNRIYNYGHRNIQGLVLLKSPLANGAIGLTAEHGPDKQDEINWIKPGNFGWNPAGARNAYDESVPMTDKTKYPDAVDAIWNSGGSTIAVSGLTFLTHSKWSQWQGWAAMATLKGQHVRVLQITGNGSVTAEKEVLDDFGRVRMVVEGPGGELFMSTDNGNGTDKIIRVIPE